MSMICNRLVTTMLNLRKNPTTRLLDFPKMCGFHTSAYLEGRPQREKLKKPEDKGTVVLGKRKWNTSYPKEGVSNKVNPILVKWVRPVTMETCNPKISGDVGGLEDFDNVDLSQPTAKMENSRALETASPEVKKVLSLEFARRRDWLEKLSQQLIKNVQRHPRDFHSPEVRIALLTIKIRNMQNELINLYPYKNPPMKAHLTRRVGARRKALADLRQNDYRKYEWLLEKLNLLYIPMPWDAPKGQFIDKDNVARKASIEKLTDMWCDELQRHRLNALKGDLEEQQPEFLRDKAEKLRGILKDEIELDLEITVTEEEIYNCVKMAEHIEEKLKNGEEKDEEDEYLIYREEIQQEENKYIGKS